MSYKFSSLQQIIDCFQSHDLLSPTQISDMLWKSKVIIHKYLKELVKQGKLEKKWQGAHTLYHLAWNIVSSHKKPDISKSLSGLSYEDTLILEDEFYKFAENGVLLQWREGFILWCESRNLNPNEKAQSFVKIKKHIDKVKNSCGVIDATEAFSKHVEKLCMQKVFYADQYNRMEFGRGKLAEMTFFAKQSQNRNLIQQCISQILLNIECLTKQHKIDAIAIVPRSISRSNQLLKILKQELSYLWLHFVQIIKYFPWKIPIPQKSLKSREQRTRNAQETIIIDDKLLTKDSKSPYKRVLLIDDFVGSGATLNQTAQKLQTAGVQHIFWFAFVGNTNLSYEVINEV